MKATLSWCDTNQWGMGRFYSLSGDLDSIRAAYDALLNDVLLWQFRLIDEHFIEHCREVSAQRDFERTRYWECKDQLPDWVLCRIEDWRNAGGDT